MMLRASSSSLTPLTLQAVAALVLVAAVLLLLAGLLYLLLAGSVAWALMVLQGLLWLALQGLRHTWATLRRHLGSATSLAADATSDAVLRPYH